MRRYLLIVVSLCCVLCVNAQKVENVKAHRDGKTVIVTYDLSEPANTSLSVSVGNGYFTKVSKVSGDIGSRVKGGKSKQIVWKPLDEYGSDNYINKDVRFRINAKPTAKVFILGEFAYSPATQYAGGFMLGMVWQWGWYIKARSSFNFTRSTDGLTCDAGGSVNGVIPFYSGKSAKPEVVLDAGIVCKLGIPLYLCVGVGYGYRNLLWETSDGKWIQNTAYSYNGVSADLCLMGCIKGFTIMAGVNTINFKYLEIECGVGWMF